MKYDISMMKMVKEYIDELGSILNKTTTLLASDYRFKILVELIRFIDKFKNNFPDEYNSMIFCIVKHDVDITYDNQIIEMVYHYYGGECKQTFNTYYSDTVVADHLKALYNKDSDYGFLYNITSRSIITIGHRVMMGLQTIEYEIEKEIDKKKEDDYTKDRVLNMLIDITIGPNSYSPKPEYYVERYHKAIKYFANIKRLNELKIDFHKLIDHDFLKEKLFGMTTFSVDHINIDLLEENYDEIEFTKDTGDDEEIIYTISDVKEIDLSWGNTEYADYLLLKSITIYLLLDILDNLNEEEEK